MSQQSKKTVKDSVIYSGLFLLLASTLFTPLSLISFWVLPLPFFILFVKQHWKVTSLCALLLAVALSWISPIAILFVLYSVMIGSAMGRAYRDPGSSGTDVFLSGLVVACVSSWLLLIIGEYFFQLIHLFRSIWNRSLEQQQSLFPTPLDHQIPVETIIPIFLLIWVFLTTFFTFIWGRWILNKQGYSKKYLPYFRHWRLPRPLFHFYIIFVLYLLLFTEPSESPVLQGIFVMLQFLFIIQGFSFCAFLLNYYRKSKWWLAPIVFMQAIPILSSLILFLGCMDTGLRVREWLLAKK